MVTALGSWLMCEVALRPPSLESSNGSTTLCQNRESGCRGREEEEHQTT